MDDRVEIKEPTESELWEMVSRYCGWYEKIPPLNIVSAVAESSDENPVFAFVK